MPHPGAGGRKNGTQDDHPHGDRQEGRPRGRVGAAPGEGSTTRRRILEIALTLMAQRGVDGTSMRDLASAAGLNVASLYHYFPSKRDLLESVLIEQGFLPIRPVHVASHDGGPERRAAHPGAAPGRDHELHVRGGGLRPAHGGRGDARRGDGPRRRPRPLRLLRTQPSRTGSQPTAPISPRVRGPPRWPACSAPWWSGSSFSTPPTCSARRGMTSPPCPSDGPARRPPSSSRRTEAPLADVRSTPAAAPTAVAVAAFTVPPEVVWAYRLDFANLPAYNPDVTGVTRVVDGSDGVHGPGARYTFGLADPRRPGGTQPIELWIVDAVSPTLVTAAMSGGSDAYEEFVVRPLDGGGCEATLTLWVTLPDGLPEDVETAAAAGSLESISKELRLMKENLEGDAAPAAS